MTFLLDPNVLIAFCLPEHLHYRSARAWVKREPRFSVCPITEGALVRFIMRSFPGGSSLAGEILELLVSSPGYEFWEDDISYRSANLQAVAGHKQVTDAYLVALASGHGGRLATFDAALSTVHPEALLVGSAPVDV